MVILLLPGCGGGAVVDEEEEIVVPYTQTIVGNRANYIGVSSVIVE